MLILIFIQHVLLIKYTILHLCIKKTIIWSSDRRIKLIVYAVAQAHTHKVWIKMLCP